MSNVTHDYFYFLPERGVDSDSCKCMQEHGQMLSACFEVRMPVH